MQTDLYKLCIDFEIRGRDVVFLGFPPALLDPSEQVIHRPGNDPHLILREVDIKACPHGVRFPRTCL